MHWVKQYRIGDYDEFASVEGTTTRYATLRVDGAHIANALTDEIAKGWTVENVLPFRLTTTGNMADVRYILVLRREQP
jgi:hypothetical protein